MIGYDRPIWYPGRENAARLVIKLATAREPVILLPGVGGSEFVTTAEINLSVDNGHGGMWRHRYLAGEKVWVNPLAIASVWPPLDFADDYFDVLKFEANGVTPVTSDLEVTNIVTEVVGLDFYVKWRPFFESQGYQFGVDLFEFPYDFRKDIALTVNDLDAQVTAALVAANGGGN